MSMHTSHALETTGMFRAVAHGYAKVMKDTLRRGRARAKLPRTFGYVTQLAKDVLSRARSKCFEQVIALTMDLARREGIEDAEQMGLHLIAIARAEFARFHPSPLCLSIEDAQLAEERAEAAVEEAEMYLAYHVADVSAQERYLVASAAHQRTRLTLDTAVRAKRIRAVA